MIIEIDPPIPMVLRANETGPIGKAVFPIAEFDLETRTDIAVYKEREYVSEKWMN